MVKIELLKNNEHGKKGDIISVTPDRANYLIRCNGAKKYVAPKRKKGPKTESKKETENDKPRVTSKSKGKS